MHQSVPILQHYPVCLISVRNRSWWHTKAERPDEYNNRQNQSNWQTRILTQSEGRFFFLSWNTGKDRTGWEREPNKGRRFRQNVRYRPVVCSEVFARSNQKTIIHYSEKRLFEIIQSGHINRVHFVVGANTHPVIRDSKMAKGNRATANLRVGNPAKIKLNRVPPLTGARNEARWRYLSAKGKEP